MKIFGDEVLPVDEMSVAFLALVNLFGAEVFQKQSWHFGQSPIL